MEQKWQNHELKRSSNDPLQDKRQDMGIERWQKTSLLSIHCSEDEGVYRVKKLGGMGSFKDDPHHAMQV